MWLISKYRVTLVRSVLAQVKEYVLAELSKTCKGKRLKGFEAIRGLLLRSHPFSVDDDTMCAPLNRASSHGAACNKASSIPRYLLCSLFVVIHKMCLDVRL